jgi:predicted AAA+ superfamily ATPase
MGALTPQGYIPRLIEGEFREYLATFGAVEVDGPKWCGKTWTSLAFAESVIHLDDWEVKELIEADLSIGLKGKQPRLIDEWHEIPQIRDAVRRSIDAGNRPGAFILTGSAAPAREARERVRHSGAGRIGRLRMRPMSLKEMGFSSGTVSLSGLFDGVFNPAEKETGLEELADYVCRGGWPAVRDMPVERAQRVARKYIDEVISFAAEKTGKSASALHGLLRSLSRNLAASVSHSTLISDIAGSEARSANRMSRETVASYLDVFRDIYILEDLNGWDAPVRSRARVRTSPKRYLVDPSLAASSLGVSPKTLLAGDLQTFGLLFETLCMRDLHVYTSANASLGEDTLRHYRDDFGLEVDAIIERKDGAWGAIEIKLSENKVQDGVDNLLRLKDKVLKNDASQARKPSFLMVLVGRSRYARITPDGVFVVPLTCLGA